MRPKVRLKMVQNGLANRRNPPNSRRKFPWHGICTLPARCSSIPAHEARRLLANLAQDARLADSYENETTPGETMLTAPLTSQPTRKPKWLAQAGVPLKSMFRAVTGRSALLMALATV